MTGQKKKKIIINKQTKNSAPIELRGYHHYVILAKKRLYFLITKSSNFNIFICFLAKQNIIIEQMQTHLNEKTNIERTGWLRRNRVNSILKINNFFFPL